MRASWDIPRQDKSSRVEVSNCMKIIKINFPQIKGFKLVEEDRYIQMSSSKLF